MTRIDWSGTGQRFYETGIDRGVLYVGDSPGVPWIGLVSVDQAQSGGAEKARYRDGIKISNRSAPEEFDATIEAFTYPLEFEPCDGTYRGENNLRLTMQRRKAFGLSYRTLIGNDLKGISLGSRIHIVYNLRAEPSQRGYQTLTESPDAMTFSWKVSARPEVVLGFRPTPHFIVDSRDVPPELFAAIEDILYGNDDTEPALPTAGELMFLFDQYEDMIYDAGSPLTPVFVTYDAGTPDTPVGETIDGGES